LISVVTITCRRQAGIKEAAHSLAVAGKGVPFEWVVVDELLDPDRFGRADELRAAVCGRFAYQHVRQPLNAFREKGLPDPNAARNAGLRAAQGPYVVFLDDNMTVSRYWLQNVAEAALGEWGFRSKLVYASRHSDQLPAVGAGWERMISPLQCSGVFGAPAWRFAAIGGFDEYYAGEMGYEDLDCVARLWATGLPFYCAQSSYAVHYAHEPLPTRKPAANRAKFDELCRRLSNTVPRQSEA